VSFGVDESASGERWMPQPEQVLTWMAELGYEGTEMGPPGYLGEPAELRGRLEGLGLDLVGAFLPLHLSRPERIEDDLRWLDERLGVLQESAPATSRPLAVLCEAIDEPERLTFTGRIGAHPETWLSAARWDSLVDNLHRAGERCRQRGIEPVIHPHAGTYLETADEVARLLDRLDASLVGLCLDTGHLRYGGADPASIARDHAAAVRHVHLKDVDTRVRGDVAARDGGFDEAVRAGVFCSCGAGDAGLAEVVRALIETGYTGWVVVEQDQWLGPDDTPASLVEGQAANRRFLRSLGL
jgi:inosose dehydratase